MLIFYYGVNDYLALTSPFGFPGTTKRPSTLTILSSSALPFQVIYPHSTSESPLWKASLIKHVIKKVDSPGFESRLCHLLAMGPWTNLCISLSLSFCLHRVGIIRAPTLEGCFQDFIVTMDLGTGLMVCLLTARPHPLVLGLVSQSRSPPQGNSEETVLTESLI